MMASTVSFLRTPFVDRISRTQHLNRKERRVRSHWSCAGLALVLTAFGIWNCPVTSGEVKPKANTARLNGMKAAIFDLEKGILKQKEYPPLPYPPGYIEFIRLLKSECGVEWEVIRTQTDSKDLREEVSGYNDVMRAEIQHRYGIEIFESLHKKAKGESPRLP